MNSPDFWKISYEERAKHDVSFMQLNPMNGFVTGDQAKGFFLKSGLATNVLGQIWNLSDLNKDGKLDKKEFSIACFLIKKVLTTVVNGAPNRVALTTSVRSGPARCGAYATLPRRLRAVRSFS